MRVDRVCVSLLLLATLLSPAVFAQPTDYDQLATVVHLEADGSICFPVERRAITAGQRVVLICPVSPPTVAYGIIDSPWLPTCGDYGNFSYHIRITQGVVPPHSPIIAFLDETLVVSIRRGVLSGKLLSGQRLYFHACVDLPSSVVSISTRRLGRHHFVWFAEYDEQRYPGAPECSDRESPHYGE